jgi:hypothetical protein
MVTYDAVRFCRREAAIGRESELSLAYHISKEDNKLK